MAKQIVPGVDTLFTYLVVDKQGNALSAIMAVLANGTRYVKTFGSNKWKLYGTCKTTVLLEEWIAAKRALFNSLPAWAKNVKSFPTLRTMECWSNDGVAMTVDGQRIEPDGVASNGAPSWLLVVGVI